MNGPQVGAAAGVRGAALATAGLILLALGAHLPALAGGFIVDDARYVVDNELLESAAGLATIWLEPAASPQYYPIVFTSFWLERQLFGLDPFAFHLVNLLLHAAVAVLAWRVLRALAVPAPWLGAALFAVHPIHVDTVAWVAERKNLLSALFALAAALLYLAFDRRRAAGAPGAWPRYLASLGAFALALLAKTAVAGLPVALALVLAWRRGDRTARRWAPLLPMLALAAGLAAVTVAIEAELVGSGDRLPEPAAIERPLLAARAALFYVGKLAWPARLSFDYGSWNTAAGAAANLLPAAVLAVVLVVLWRRRASWGAGPLVALLAYLALAAPSLGLVTFYFHRYAFVADHFVYLPSLPLLALAAASGRRALGVLGLEDRRHRAALAALALATLGTLTWRHAGDYRDHETLARAILRVRPESWLAHNHLGNEALRQRRFEGAIEHLERAETLAPDRVETQINLALARMNAGDLPGAERHVRRVIELRPRAALGAVLLGDLRLRGGRFDEATAAYGAARELDPGSARARSGEGIALARAGRHREAVARLAAAVAADPANAAARTAYGFSLAALGRRAEALGQLEAALALEPDDPATRRNLELLRAGPVR